MRLKPKVLYEKLRQLCLKQANLEAKLPSYSIDILVEFKPDAKIGFFEFARLQRQLGDFNRRRMSIDLD